MGNGPPAAGSWPEVADILATAYLRLLAKHDPNWRERLALRETSEDEESSKKRSNRLDFRGNRSIRCPGQRTVTLTREGS